MKLSRYCNNDAYLIYFEHKYEQSETNALTGLVIC